MIPPRVSIILPVFNGENFVRQAIESVLNQTYRDFEFLILDNASTDATEQICRGYAAADARIRYLRHAKNLGASMNHILGFRMARGEYVKHIAHDDAWGPTLLEKSVRALDERPGTILVCSKTRLIDEKGETIEDFDPKLDFSATRTRDRIRAAVWGRHRAYPIFGLVRSSAMAKTKYLQPFVDSDRVWLARLALQGPFYEIPEYLFFSRMHLQRYGSHADRPSVQLAWFDPAKRRKLVFPAVRLYFEYLRAILEAKLPLAEKAACLWVSGTCFRERWWRGKLRNDFIRPIVYAGAMLGRAWPRTGTGATRQKAPEAGTPSEGACGGRENQQLQNRVGQAFRLPGLLTGAAKQNTQLAEGEK